MLQCSHFKDCQFIDRTELKRRQTVESLLSLRPETAFSLGPAVLECVWKASPGRSPHREGPSKAAPLTQDPPPAGGRRATAGGAGDAPTGRAAAQPVRLPPCSAGAQRGRPASSGPQNAPKAPSRGRRASHPLTEKERSKASPLRSCSGMPNGWGWRFLRCRRTDRALVAAL